MDGRKASLHDNTVHQSIPDRSNHRSARASGFDGTVHGAVPAEDRHGIAGGALLFDEIGDRVQVDSTPPVVLEIAIASDESATLQLKRERDRLYHRVQRRPASESVRCQAGVGSKSAGAAAPAAWVSRP